MNPALLIKLRPTTPWRISPPGGSPERVEAIVHSDTLYSAVTLAMEQLGMLEQWLAATAGSAEPAVRFSSGYPFLGSTLLVAPPRNLWPPPPSARVRWKAARYVPVRLVETLVNDPHARTREDDWVLDAESECLLPASRSGRVQGPFQIGMRRTVPVDRLTGAAGAVASVACLEFQGDAGVWCVAVFSNEAAQDDWLDPLQAAARLLADGGIGGERSRGWGRSACPEFERGLFPEILMKMTAIPQPAAQPPVAPPPVEAAPAPPATPAPATPAPAPAAEAEGEVGVEGAIEPSPEAGSEPGVEPSAELVAEPVVEPVAEPVPEPVPVPVPAAPAETAYWLLSLFRPAETDGVDWSRGAYSLVDRGGRIESPMARGELKKGIRMVSEGSVVFASNQPVGSAPDVAPEGFPHPVYRAGYALAIPIQWRVMA